MINMGPCPQEAYSFIGERKTKVAILISTVCFGEQLTVGEGGGRHVCVCVERCR